MCIQKECQVMLCSASAFKDKLEAEIGLVGRKGGHFSTRENGHFTTRYFGHFSTRQGSFLNAPGLLLRVCISCVQPLRSFSNAPWF